MDKKTKQIRVEFMTQIANQVGVLQYANNVPQQGAVNSVYLLISKLAESKKININNPNDVNQIKENFQTLMSHIISENGD